MYKQTEDENRKVELKRFSLKYLKSSTLLVAIVGLDTR